MFAQPSHPNGIPGRASRPWLRLAAALLLLAACASSALALTISEVKVVNVTPSGFSVIWLTSEPAQPGLTVYSDAAGNASLTGQVGIEVFPLNTGRLSAANAYEQRLASASMNDKTKGLNMNMVRVTGCLPGRTYYFRARATAAGGASVAFPPSSPLPPATLPAANSFVAQAKQLIVNLPAGTTEGALVTLSTADASHPLAAVAGDGVAPNQVFFNLSEFFASDGRGNLAVTGDRVFTLNILGTPPPDNSASYTLHFESGFLVAEADIRGFAREDLIAVSLGTTALTRNQAGSVPIGLVSGARFYQIEFRIRTAADQLANLTVESARPDVFVVDVTHVAPGNLVVTLSANDGFTISAAPEIARLRFHSTPGTHSAIAPLALSSLQSVDSSFGSPTNRLLLDGKVFIIGAEPILDATLAETGQRQVTLYGLPGVTYVAESTTDLNSPIVWRNPVQITLEGLSRLLEGVPADGNAFFRAERQP